MIVESYISNDIIPLKIEDSFKLSAHLMDDEKFSYFPVVKDNNLYVGLVSDKVLYELDNLNEKIFTRKDLLKNYFVYNNKTIFDATSIVLEHNLDILPVIDCKHKYLGVLTIRDILEAYTSYAAVNAQGDILQLTLNCNDLCVSEISRIIENENGHIINLFVMPIKETTKIKVFIKLARMELCRVMKAFERYNYDVEYFVQSTESDDEELIKNYDLLMKYLSI
ncbi:MAG: CBS domain-containing protein [Bacteroidales bacterium]|nr:CBS domain-containing protein [Bacteroidales bacterium]